MSWFDRFRNLPVASRSKLAFPNPSRSYDATRRGVRFWGNSNAMESAFFVSDLVLGALQPGLGTGEHEILSAFDVHQALIQAAASKAYARGPRGVYDLQNSDF